MVEGDLVIDDVLNLGSSLDRVVWSLLDVPGIRLFIC